MKFKSLTENLDFPKRELFSALKELTGTHRLKTSRNFELFDDGGGVFKISESRAKWEAYSFRALTFFLFLCLVSRQEKESLI